MAPYPTIIDDPDAGGSDPGSWADAFRFPPFTAHADSGADTGRRGGFPPVAPSTALSTHVHDSEVHRD